MHTVDAANVCQSRPVRHQRAIIYYLPTFQTVLEAIWWPICWCSLPFLSEQPLARYRPGDAVRPGVRGSPVVSAAPDQLAAGRPGNPPQGPRLGHPLTRARPKIKASARSSDDWLFAKSCSG
jgi:hypothetical protein